MFADHHGIDNQWTGQGTAGNGLDDGGCPQRAGFGGVRREVLENLIARLPGAGEGLFRVALASTATDTLMGQK